MHSLSIRSRTIFRKFIIFTNRSGGRNTIEIAVITSTKVFFESVSLTSIIRPILILRVVSLLLLLWCMFLLPDPSTIIWLPCIILPYWWFFLMWYSRTWYNEYNELIRTHAINQANSKWNKTRVTRLVFNYIKWSKRLIDWRKTFTKPTGIPEFSTFSLFISLWSFWVFLGMWNNSWTIFCLRFLFIRHQRRWHWR